MGLRVRGEDLRHQAGASVPRIARDAMHEALDQTEEGSLERVPQLVRVIVRVRMVIRVMVRGVRVKVRVRIRVRVGDGEARLSE